MGLIIVDGPRAHYANDAFRALVGRDLDELKSMGSLLDLVCDSDRDAVARDFTAMIGGIEPMRVRQTCLVRRDGTKVSAEVFVCAATAARNGGPPRLVCVVQRPTRQSS
jgi:PAS domain S-box-containing protein